MTDGNDEATENDPDNTSPEVDEAGQTMADVDHTHPDTDESFTETGVYDRGKKRADETHDG